MKHFFLAVFCLLIFNPSHAVNIGVIGSSIYTGSKKSNFAMGGGVLFSFPLKFKNSEINFHFNVVTKNGEFNDCYECPTDEIITTFHYYDIGVNWSWKLKSFQQSVIRIGPIVNYSEVNASQTGQVANWIEVYKSEYICTGLAVNYKFLSVLKLPLDLGFQISPQYCFRIYNKPRYDENMFDSEKNRTILNFQVALSYKFSK